MSYLKCNMCQEGEGCRTRSVSVSQVFTPQVCTYISAVCTCISVASLVAILYVTLR